jgi:hypothetical protein
MKNLLKKYGVLVSFILAFVLDGQYGILEKLLPDPFWLNVAKGFGAILLAYFTKEKLGIQSLRSGAVIPKKGF